MKISLPLLSLTILLTACRNQAVSAKPTKSDITGEYICEKFPAGFLDQIGGAQKNVISKMSINNDGSLTANNFPQKSPYRLTEVHSYWEFSDPSINPSGSWSLEFQGDYLQCRESGSQMILRYLRI